MTPYVVRQGDYLQKLADQLGFDADAVWKLPENKPLRDLGRDPNMLCPCDILYYPESDPPSFDLKPGSTTTFTSTKPTVTLTVRFMADGEALASEPYTVDDDVLPAGSLDGDGTLNAEIDSTVEDFTVRFPKRFEVYTVQVGHLDPIDEPSGIAQRLAHLGYVTLEPDVDLSSSVVENGLRMFQRDNQLEETGDLDDATKQQLLKVHGS
jgi:hypothetical protein